MTQTVARIIDDNGFVPPRRSAETNVEAVGRVATVCLLLLSAVLNGFLVAMRRNKSEAGLDEIAEPGASFEEDRDSERLLSTSLSNPPHTPVISRQLSFSSTPRDASDAESDSSPSFTLEQVFANLFLILSPISTSWNLGRPIVPKSNGLFCRLSKKSVLENYNGVSCSSAVAGACNLFSL